MRSIKNFCLKNGYYLIIKSRSKRLLGGEFEYYSDRVFYDEQLMPSTLLELMKVSNNIFSYITTASGEAVYSGSYHYTIFEKTFSKIQSIYLRSFDRNYFSFNGVNEIVTTRQFCEILKKSGMKKINIKSRKNYLKKYFECYSKNRINLPKFLNKI